MVRSAAGHERVVGAHLALVDELEEHRARVADFRPAGRTARVRG
ncbi:hypothetical protein ACGFX2_32195 [Streptomyces goshikiensis]